MRRLLPVEKLIQAVFGFLDLAAEDSLPEQEYELLKTKLEPILKTLTKEERDVICMRSGLGDGHEYTPEQTSKALGITKHHIQRIERTARNKMGSPLMTWNLHQAIKEAGLSELAARIRPKLDSLPKIYEAKKAS